MHVQNLMNSLWDIHIFLGLEPKESHCICTQAGLVLRQGYVPEKCHANQNHAN